MTILAFRKKVWAFYGTHGRHELPWRKTRDPYRILVSEIMLQQTQVPRVIGKYKEFLCLFPNVHVLADAPLSDVLRAWSGLGYNRRAKFLQAAARAIVNEYGGRVPKDGRLLRNIPGIGPYTASAVRVFAFNEPDVLLETNVRAAFIHHFFQRREKVSDTELLPLVEAAARRQEPREWHAALFDYGAYLKSLHKNPARKSAHYVRQSPFKGSRREVRGAIVRSLRNGEKSVSALRAALENSRHFQAALQALLGEGIIRKKGASVCIAE